jgi:hypothetical protein
MDRTYFLTQQVERLDDQAFAAFLAWFDRYADLRWAGRSAAEDAGAAAGGMSVACIARNAGYERIAAMPERSRMVCEPQAAAWLAQMMPRE